MFFNSRKKLWRLPSLNPKQIGLILGPVFFGLVVVLFPSSEEGLSKEGVSVLAVSIWMIIWWITEAIPVYATALLPLALMPILGVLPLQDIAAEYMHPIIVLLLGMFLIAIAIEKSEFHKRIAYEMLGIFGYSPRRIVLGFMISTALMSSVIMSTTVVLIMLPIAFVVLRDLSIHHIAIGTRFRTTLLLGIAYSSSIGSVSILIGAPPNLLYAGTVSEIFNYNTTFVEWSSLGAPLSITMLLITCFYLLKVLDKEKIVPIDDNTNNTKGYSDTINSNDEKKAKDQQKKSVSIREDSYNHDIRHISSTTENEFKKIVQKEKHKLEKVTTQQKTVVGILVIVLLLMFTSQLWIPTDSFITNSVIAILGGISLFAIPMRKHQTSLLGWAEVERLPFGVLFLLGGGLALSLAFVNSGLANWLAGSLSVIAILPFEIVVVLIIGLIMFMSNLKSNTSTAAIFIPIVANMALINQWSPLPILFGITVASSFAFLLPMGTPPNALVYEKGKVSMKDMFMNGIVLNFIAIALIMVFTIFIAPMMLTLK